MGNRKVWHSIVLNVAWTECSTDMWHVFHISGQRMSTRTAWARVDYYYYLLLLYTLQDCTRFKFTSCWQIVHIMYLMLTKFHSMSDVHPACTQIIERRWGKTFASSNNSYCIFNSASAFAVCTGSLSATSALKSNRQDSRSQIGVEVVFSGKVRQVVCLRIQIRQSQRLLLSCKRNWWNCWNI